MRAIRKFAIVALVAMAYAAQFSSAQSSSAQVTKERTFWPEYPLAPLVYPPIANQARIMGDVNIRISIHRDGSVVSAEVVSGHPMLQPAALESARKSKFYCWPDCTDEVTTFVFTYTFGTYARSCCCDAVRLRAAKCLYLWRCGPWQSEPPEAPAIGVSANRIIVLADAMCVQTNTAASQGAATRPPQNP
jgi:TonB family protein